MNNKVRFTTNLDSELLRKIKIYAVVQGKNLNDLIEENFRELIKKDLCFYSEDRKDSNIK